jgi:hypothetical protein
MITLKCRRIIIVIDEKLKMIKDDEKLKINPPETTF